MSTLNIKIKVQEINFSLLEQVQQRIEQINLALEQLASRVGAISFTSLLSAFKQVDSEVNKLEASMKNATATLEAANAQIDKMFGNLLSKKRSLEDIKTLVGVTADEILNKVEQILDNILGKVTSSVQGIATEVTSKTKTVTTGVETVFTRLSVYAGSQLAFFGVLLNDTFNSFVVNKLNLDVIKLIRTFGAVTVEGTNLASTLKFAGIVGSAASESIGFQAMSAGLAIKTAALWSMQWGLVGRVFFGGLLVTAIKHVGSEFKQFGKRLLGISSATPILERVKHLITLLDTSLSNINLTVGRVFKTAIYGIATIWGPFAGIVAGVPFLNSLITSTINLFTKSRLQVFSLFGSSRSQIQLIMLEVRLLVLQALKLIPVIKDVSKNFAGTNKNVNKLTKTQGIFGKFKKDLDGMNSTGKSISRLKLPIAGQLQVFATEIKGISEGLLRQINKITLTIQKATGMTREQIDAIAVAARKDAVVVSSQAEKAATKVQDLLKKTRIKSADRKSLFEGVVKTPQKLSNKQKMDLFRKNEKEKADFDAVKIEPRTSKSMLDFQQVIKELLKTLIEAVKQLSTFQKVSKDLGTSKIASAPVKAAKKEIQAFVESTQQAAEFVPKHLESVAVALRRLKVGSVTKLLTKNPNANISPLTNPQNPEEAKKIARRKQVDERNAAVRPLATFFSSLEKGQITKPFAKNIEKVSESFRVLFKDINPVVTETKEFKIVMAELAKFKPKDLLKDPLNAKQNLKEIKHLISELTGKPLKDLQSANKASSNFIGGIFKGLSKGGPEGKRKATQAVELILTSLQSMLVSPFKAGPLKNMDKSGGKLGGQLGDGFKKAGPKLGKEVDKVLDKHVASKVPKSPVRAGPLMGLVSSGNKIVGFIAQGISQGANSLGSTTAGVLQVVIDEINKVTDSLFLSIRIGDSVENVDLLKGVIAETGADARDLDFVLSSAFSRTFSEEQLKTMRDFGVDMQKIKQSATPAVDLFKAMAENVKTFGVNSTITTKALNTLGIMQTSNLIPALELVGNNFDELAQKQIDLGLVTSSAFAEQARALKVTFDAYERLRSVLKQEFFGGFLSQLNQVSQGLLDFTQKNRVRISALMKYVGTVFGAVIKMFSRLVQFAMDEPTKAFNIASNALTTSFDFFIEQFGNLFDYLGSAALDTATQIGVGLISIVGTIAGELLSVLSEKLGEGAGNVVSEFLWGTIEAQVQSKLGKVRSQGVPESAMAEIEQSIREELEKPLREAEKRDKERVHAATRVLKAAVTTAKASIAAVKDDAENLGKAFNNEEFQTRAVASLEKFKRDMKATIQGTPLTGIIDEFKKSISFDNFGIIEENLKKTKTALKEVLGIEGESKSIKVLDKIVEAARRAKDGIANVLGKATLRNDAQGALKLRQQEDLAKMRKGHAQEVKTLESLNATKEQMEKLLSNHILEERRQLNKNSLELDQARLRTGSNFARRVSLEISARVGRDSKARNELELLQLREKHEQELIEIRRHLADKSEIEINAELDKARRLQQTETQQVTTRQTGGGDFLSSIGNELNTNPTLPMTDGMQNLIDLAGTTGTAFTNMGQVFGDIFEASGRKLKAFMILQKSMSLTSAIINVAVGVTKALTDLPPPLSFIQAAAVAAMGGVQIAKIASQGYYFGGLVDDANPNRDSKTIGVRGGEFVLTPQATQAATVGFLDDVNNLRTPKYVPEFIRAAVPAVGASSGINNNIKSAGASGLAGNISGAAARGLSGAGAGGGSTPIHLHVAIINQDVAGAVNEALASTEASNVIMNSLSKKKTKFNKLMK